MIFLFDFDGVLIDSAWEAALSAYNAVTEQQLLELAQMPKSCMDLFQRNKFLFHNPSSLYLLMQWCVENYQSKPDYQLTESEFHSYIEQEEGKRPLAELGAYFYSVRNRFMESSREKWLAINYPYQPLWNFLKEENKTKFYILTAKNRKAVLELTKHYGMEIGPEDIYSGDGNKSKISNFKEILSRFGEKHFFFIDDHLVNLQDIDSSFNSEARKLVDLAICNWGYASAQELETAEKSGFKQYSQQELINLLKNFSR
ncbi:MAG: hypothetical protein KBC84_04155 [Proteobacteria bacterium]|nr:hypothetical protein [Pseudomonadota bacterium]